MWFYSQKSTNWHWHVIGLDRLNLVKLVKWCKRFFLKFINQQTFFCYFYQKSIFYLNVNLKMKNWTQKNDNWHFLMGANIWIIFWSICWTLPRLFLTDQLCCQLRFATRFGIFFKDLKPWRFKFFCCNFVKELKLFLFYLFSWFLFHFFKLE